MGGKLILSGLAACFALGVATSLYLDEYAPKRKGDMVAAESLHVNRNDDQWNMTVKGEVEGIADMRSALEKSIYEEAWAFLPKVNEWHEVGKNSKNFKSCGCKGASVQVDSDYLLHLMINNDEIVVYHTHPKFIAYEDFLRDKINRPVKSTCDGEGLFKGVPHDAFPSPNDLVSMIDSAKKFYRIKPNGSFKERLCSQHGVTEFYLTKDAWKQYDGKSTVQIANSLSMLYTRADSLGRAANLFYPSSDPLVQISRRCEAMSDNNMVVKFMPYQ